MIEGDGDQDSERERPSIVSILCASCQDMSRSQQWLSLDYFCLFVQAHEEVRIRREVLCLGPQQWYTQEFKLMSSLHLTNVRREDDRSTRQVRMLSQRVHCIWEQSNKVEVTRLLIFNIALWRLFGTTEFMKSLVFLEAESVERR